MSPGVVTPAVMTTPDCDKDVSHASLTREITLLPVPQRGTGGARAGTISI
jgi:hypothetical protein